MSICDRDCRSAAYREQLLGIPFLQCVNLAQWKHSSNVDGEACVCVWATNDHHMKSVYDMVVTIPSPKLKGIVCWISTTNETTNAQTHIRVFAKSRQLSQWVEGPETSARWQQCTSNASSNTVAMAKGLACQLDLCELKCLKCGANRSNLTKGRRSTYWQ